MIELEERMDKLEMIMIKTHLMLQGFIAGLEELKEENKKENKKLKRELAEISRKMGTIVEDMIIPNIEYIAKKYFNLKNSKTFTRTKAYHSKDNSRQKEFDVIAVYSDKVILNETKSSPKPEYAKEFAEFIKSNDFYNYFPEYEGKELIPVFASIHLPEDIVKYLSKQRIYAMGMKEDTMDIINFDIIQTAMSAGTHNKE